MRLKMQLIIILFYAALSVAGMSEDYSNIFTVNTISGSANNNPVDVLLLTTQISCAPNPFNSSTLIKLYTNFSGIAKIRVTNISGEEVYGMQLGMLEPGVVKTLWNAAGLSSGIYFIEFSTGEKQVVRKAVKLR